MNKVLLFDADGVMTLPEESFTVLYARSHGLEPEPFEEFFRTEWLDFVLGKKDLKEHIVNNPELWKWKGDADSLLNYWFEIEDVRNEELIALIKELRKIGYKCYMATQQEKYRGKYMRTVMFPGLFDGYFVTADLGVDKNQPDFYKKILEELSKSMPGLNPSDVTFFDDSQSKVDAANAFGINGILYGSIDSVRKAVGAV